MSVPRLWPGATFVCLGSGPSLTPDDVEACQWAARVIAVNDTYHLAPFADCLYAADARWWQHHGGAKDFTGLKYALERGAAIWPGVQVLRNTGQDGLEDDPTGLRTGLNSGYQAIGLAVHFGAAKIVLLGYDMQPDQTGRTHWFGHHPRVLNRASPYQRFAACFATLVAPLAAKSITIVNASRHTALTCFDRKPLAEALS